MDFTGLRRSARIAARLSAQNGTLQASDVTQALPLESSIVLDDVERPADANVVFNELGNTLASSTVQEHLLNACRLSVVTQTLMMNTMHSLDNAKEFSGQRMMPVFPSLFTNVLVYPMPVSLRTIDPYASFNFFSPDRLNHQLQLFLSFSVPFKSIPVCSLLVKLVHYSKLFIPSKFCLTPSEIGTIFDFFTLCGSFSSESLVDIIFTLCFKSCFFKSLVLDLTRSMILINDCEAAFSFFMEFDQNLSITRFFAFLRANLSCPNFLINDCSLLRKSSRLPESNRSFVFLVHHACQSNLLSYLPNRILSPLFCLTRALLKLRDGLPMKIFSEQSQQLACI